jgi:CubicO group peptidase (beta-lactamase class C family)
MTEPHIDGFVADGFEAVRDAFAANFERHGEVGAGFALYVEGECVVDLTGGVTRPGGEEPYGRDHLQLVFSTTKGATALCAHLLAQRGELDLDAPVTRYWPEFAAHGKGDVPVRWLLSHQVGLPDVDRPMTYEETLAWDPVAEALAASAPLWEPGTRHGYHAVTYGWLVGEVVRRVSGRSLGQFFAEEVAGPLGLEFWIGLPEEHHDRVVPILPMEMPEGLGLCGGDGGPAGGQAVGERPSMVKLLEQLMGPDSLVARALTAPGGALASEGAFNDPALWRAELPAANGIGNARSVARMYAAMVSEVDGIRLLNDDTVARAIEVQTSGPDAVLMFEIPFGLGFMRNSAFSPMGSEHGFGHYGAGGSLGFADPQRRIAGGYVMNQMQMGIAGDPRTAGLLAATYASLA